MLATKIYDENTDTSIPQCIPEKELPSPPTSRKSRKHRPTPLDLSPPQQRQHLSPLDSNNPNALDDYLFSNTPGTAQSNVGMGMPSPAHYSQTDLMNILDSNPPLTPVPPLRTAPLHPQDTEGLGVDVPDGAPLSPGLPPALHAEEGLDGPFDEIFLELLHTETSFLSEVETIEVIVREVLQPLDVVDSAWLNTAMKLKELHTGFVGQLGAGDRAGITPIVLKSILKWPESAQEPYREYISSFRLGLDALLSGKATEEDISRLSKIKAQIVPEGSEQVTLDYLFKRPLVRLRYYSKLYKYWTHFPPQIIDGDSITSLGQDVKNELSLGHDAFKTLVSKARNRVSDEKARLQGETIRNPPPSATPSKSTSQPQISQQSDSEPQQNLSSLLNGVDCSRCKEITNTNSKSFSLTDFLNSNPGEPLFHKELFTTLPDEQFPDPPRQASHIIILANHLILLGLSTSPSPSSANPSPPATKWLMFPPIFGAALNIFTTDTYIEIILGGGASVRFQYDADLELVLRELRQRGIGEEGGRSPRPKEYLTSPPIGGMRRSPAMGGLAKSPSLGSGGWTLTDTVGSDKTVELSRGWSFEMRTRANTAPPAREPPPIPDTPDETVEGKKGHERGDSVSLVRGVLKLSPSPSPTPSPTPSPAEEVEEEPISNRAPPPKMASLRRGSSPIRRGAIHKAFRQDTLTPNYISPVASPLPRSPSLPQQQIFSRSPSVTRERPQFPPPIPRSPQPRSLSPSRSVPAQLHDLPHFPVTPTKHDPSIPILPALEFGQSPLGMRNYLRNGGTSPRRGPVDGSPLAKERYGRLTPSSSQTSLPANSTNSPSMSRSTSPAMPSTILSPLVDADRGRVSPSPTVCTFPPRTMRLDEGERLAGTRSVDDLRRMSGPRQGALSRLDHRNSGSSGSASVEDEELSSQLMTPTMSTGFPGRILHSGVCLVYFWKRGGWHRPELQSEESVITVESFGAAGRGRAASISPPKVILRVTDSDATQQNVVVLQHEILPTASIRRDSPSEVSIGCDNPAGKKDYYLFACHDPGEADGLYHALNTGRYFVGGVTEEQLRQATSLFGRTTSFASSLATNSSVGSTISSFSFYDTPPLPTMPAEFSPVEEQHPIPALPLEERQLVRDHKVKVFLRQDAGIWKNLGNGKCSVFTTGPEVRLHVIQPTKKNPTAMLMDGRIFESGACERVGRTGVAVNLLSREGKICVYMLQSKNDKEAQVVFDAIRKGKSAV